MCQSIGRLLHQLRQWHDRRRRGEEHRDRVDPPCSSPTAIGTNTSSQFNFMGRLPENLRIHRRQYHQIQAAPTPAFVVDGTAAVTPLDLPSGCGFLHQAKRSSFSTSPTGNSPETSPNSKYITQLSKRCLPPRRVSGFDLRDGAAHQRWRRTSGFAPSSAHEAKVGGRRPSEAGPLSGCATAGLAARASRITSQKSERRCPLPVPQDFRR
jgi:hypothetical protein